MQAGSLNKYHSCQLALGAFFPFVFEPASKTAESPYPIRSSIKAHHGNVGVASSLREKKWLLSSIIVFFGAFLRGNASFFIQSRLHAISMTFRDVPDFNGIQAPKDECP